MDRDPALQEAALAGWCDDSSAPEEVQALRAWVAGLAAALRQAREERDEAQRALAAARAEIERLESELAALREAAAPTAPIAAGAPAAASTTYPQDPNGPRALPTDHNAPSRGPGHTRLLAAALVVLGAVVLLLVAVRAGYWP